MSGQNLSAAYQLSNQNNYKNLFFYACPGGVVRARNRFHEPAGGLNLGIPHFLPIPLKHCYPLIHPLNSLAQGDLPRNTARSFL